MPEEVDHLNVPLPVLQRLMQMVVVLSGLIAALLLCFILFLVLVWGELSAARESQRTLVECTTPGPRAAPDTGHPCFDRGNASTGKAIQSINLSTIYSAECALERTSQPEAIQTCVEQKLALHQQIQVPPGPDLVTPPSGINTTTTTP